MIKASNVTKIYKNGFKAVDNLNLHIEEGDIYGFLGPNGAGKSTTVKILLGIINEYRGEVKIFGENILENRIDYKRRIGYVPEDQGVLAN